MGRSLYLDNLNRESAGCSKPKWASSPLGAKPGKSVLAEMEPTASQDVALMRGGKIPMVLISVVQGVCKVAGRRKGLASPTAGDPFWEHPRLRAPSPTRSATAADREPFLPASAPGWQSSFGSSVAYRGQSMPEETFRFSVGFQSKNFLEFCNKNERLILHFT